MADTPTTFDIGAVKRAAALGGPPTRDDQSITNEGVVIDTKEKAVAYFASVEERVRRRQETQQP